MSAADVYSPTTAAAAQQNKPRCITVPSENLDTVRCCVKAVEVILSFVAFVLEEVVNSCLSCGPLYFFEFVSCTAFLFTLLLLILLITPLHQKVGISRWKDLDFVYSSIILAFFFIASVVFLADNGGTDVEKVAAVFGILASLAFLLDVGLFVKRNGIPCRKNKQRPNSSAVPVSENEKLNANGSD